MQNLQREAPQHAEKHRQLAAVRFYLHFMLWECESRWAAVAEGVTNYKTLLDRIERYRKGSQPVCLVTFNYDTMLEDALAAFGVRIKALEDYVGDDRFKLFKLHGSVNWAREVNTPLTNLANIDTWQAAHELIKNAASLDVSDRFVRVTEHPIGKLGESAVFPAIALPLESKSGFECPASHVEALKSFVPDVDRLLLVGWRATESDFMSLLRAGLRKAPYTYVIAADEKNAQQTVARFRDYGIQFDYVLARGGFTDVINKRELESFLRS